MRNLKYCVRDEIGILEFDQPDSKVNVLTTAVMTEFSDWLNTLNKDEIKGVALISRKPGIFIAGADIHEIEGITDKREGQEKSRLGQEVFERLERLGVPTLAVINGACLGGGLELALACRYRTSGFDEKIKIGLPEAKLGVVPGFGGTVRLTRLVGPMKAAEMIPAGKVISSRDAFKIGLVNWLFQDSRLIEDSLEWFKDVIQGKAGTRLGPSRKKRNLIRFFLEKTPPGRALLFNQAKKMILKQTKGKYPAPLKALWLIKKGSYGLEAKTFGELVVSEVSKNLIRLFFLDEKYKKETWARGDYRPRRVKKCGVLGAGVMGGGIAQLLSYYNTPVRMKDLNLGSISKGLSYAGGVYRSALKKKKLRPNEVAYKMGLISGTLDYTGFKGCDFVIEAVVENLEIKKKVFGEISNIVKEDAILASNTSALSVSKMAQAVRNPERVVGMHFFNPVHLMPLIEVIKAEATSPETIYNTVNFSKHIGKVPIVVKDSCGFLVNRILLPYLNEAGYLLEEGALGIYEIDRRISAFGMPMGPFTLMDEIGLDVGYKVAKILEGGFGPRMKVCGLLNKLNDEKLFGKKTGAGFYIYRKKKRIINKRVDGFIEKDARGKMRDDDVIMRVLCLMVNEAARCLEEGVAGGPSDVDIGMIMGTGFPPFRGGLLRWADSVGAGRIVEYLKGFGEKINPERFSVCGYLAAMAKEKKNFYKD
ncbi:MAG: enoyl-CoA hydratase/isomerase family protein [Candidatus Omnitrophica bacterium]|nr:enoyl-CoA hydratase/isomerase family protein [Candidatus Omnitrophota bacterium]